MSVRVLGSLDVGGAPLQPRERAMFSALVLRLGQPLSVAELADAYWGDRSRPATWPAQVKVSIGRIRARTGSDAVATRVGGYAFGLDPDVVDAVAFERLVASGRRHLLGGDGERAADAYRRALALWNGVAFADLPDWEPAVVESSRLGEVRTTAEEELLEARLAAGEHRSTIADAERLVRALPLREERWALLALANYRAGRQAEALAVLREARRRLRDELGIEPGERLRGLEEAVLRQDPGLAPVAAPREVSDECPYRGLRSYGPDDADSFFGRDAEVEALLERVRPGALVVVLGPSGAGKSSVMLAGLGPRLADRGRSVTTLRPTVGAFERLAASCDEAVPGAVLVDQGEELARMPDDVRVTAVASLLRVLDGGGTVVMTLRSDALDALIAVPSLGERVADGLTALGPVSIAALRDIVEKPAQRAGLRLEPGLVELVIRDAGDRYATLPYVSHALAQTWARREGSTLTVAGYQSAGGIAGSVAQSAEAAYLAMPEQERTICRAVLLRLIERGPEGGHVRGSVPTASLVADAPRRRVIERLVRARLLRIDEGTLSVAHEAITTAWPRLESWLEEDGEGARMVGSVAAAAEVWDASGRPDDELWRGARLQAAGEWRAASAPDLTEVERAFLDASDALHSAELRAVADAAARDRRQNRRLRWALGGAALLLVSAVVLGGVAAVRGQEAASAQSDAQFEALAATAQSTRDSDRFGAALLAAELYRRRPDDARATSALLAVLSAPDAPSTTVTFGAAERTFAAALPGTTQVLAVTGGVGASADGARAELWDLATATLVRRLDVALPPITTEFPGQAIVDDAARRALIVIPTRDAEQRCCIEQLVTIDLTTGTAVASRDLDGILAVGGVFSADGSTVVMRALAGDLPVWLEADTLRTDVDPRIVVDAEPRPGSVARLADGSFAVGLRERVDVYDATTHRRTASIPLHADIATRILVPASDRTLLGCGPDGTALLDLATGALRWQRASTDPYDCVSMVATDGGTYIEQRTTAVEHRVDTGEPTGREFTASAEWTVKTGLLGDGSLYVVNQRTTPFITRFPLDGGGPISRLAVPGRAASGGFVDDSSIVVTAADEGGEARSVVWDLDRDEPVGEPAWDIRPLGDDVVGRQPTSSSGFELADARTGRTWSLPGSSDVDLDPGGPGTTAFAVGNATILAFDAKTGEQRGVPLDFDGKVLWGVWRMIHEVPGTDRAVITWWDVDAAETTTAVFDLATGAKLAEGLAGDAASIVVPGGDVISTNSSEMRRSTDLLKPSRSLPKPTAGANLFEISDDGRILLLAGQAQKASLYDVATDRKLGFDLATYSPQFMSAHLSPDGRTLVTNAREGVMEWDLDPADMAAAACRMAGRELTAAEWETFFPGEPQTSTCGG